MVSSARVRMSSAPYALSRLRRSSDIDSGIVKTSRYPFTAHTSASPMPVFPDVGSTITDSPGRMRPSRSAASIIASAMRSFTDRPLHRAHDVADRDRLGRARQRVAAVGPALPLDELGPFQLLEDLLEVAQRHLLAPRDVARLRGLAATVVCDVEHRAHRITRLR